MNKILCLILVFVLIFSLASCNGKTTGEDTAESVVSTAKEIELTKDNIDDYLIISGQYSKIEREYSLGISFGYSDFTINVEPAVSGKFNKASIVLRVKLTYGWSVSSSDPAYSESNEYLTTTIRLPYNGTKNEIHSLIASFAYDNHNNQNVEVEIVSVTGTFVPDN